MKKILVIASHPDDEALGCAGTLAKRIHAGDEVYSLVLGEGITARYDNSHAVDKKEIISLHQMSQKVAEFLGFSGNWSYNFPDNRFDSISLLDIVKAIENIKNKVKPDIVFTHHYGDLNIDHRITFNAVLTACRPMNGETIRSIYSFETPSATEWSYCGQSSFKPTVFVDISDFIGIKKQAISFYKDELRSYPHPRSAKSLEVVANRIGISVGVQYAEAFELVRKIM